MVSYSPLRSLVGAVQPGGAVNTKGKKTRIDDGGFLGTK